MSEDANLRFSAEEMRLVTDAAWILTKNSVMEKVVHMMARLSEQYREIWGGHQWEIAIDPGSPKISRGENYQGLPWVMLDYPRIFGREDVMAIRTMFWWGHAFIVTLHLKGKYRRLFLPMLQRYWPDLDRAGFHVGIAEDEWQHEHGSENYRPLSRGEDLESGLTFLKLSASIGVIQWGEAMKSLSAWFTVLTAVLANYPGDETNPSPGSSRVDSGL